MFCYYKIKILRNKYKIGFVNIFRNKHVNREYHDKV